ncbi:MAG: 3-oxoacid CoA-transferase subunit A [Ignavibacteria bacterium]|nr:3-oxoacid CoA-transferase subunit A [Ignavibacteria bacterium]
MINKIVKTVHEAVADIFDGATIMISGFGEAGSPIELIHALIDQGAKDLTVISNNAGSGYVGLASLIEHRRVRKIICSFPKTTNSKVFPELYFKGEIELELVPQGTLAERIRAGGAGIPAFYTPTSVDTILSEGKEKRIINDKMCVLEYALKADFSLVKCLKADRFGNLVYNKTARNFGPIMCMAANTTIVQAKQIVELGELDPECIVTPGIFVNRIVEVKNPADESKLVEENRRYPW